MARPSLAVELELSAGVWTDVTADIRQTSPVTIQRGTARMTQGMPFPQVGRISFVLDNLARDYDPEVVTTLKPGVRVRIRATYSAVTYPLVLGYLDAVSPAWSEDGRDAVTELTAGDGIKVLSQGRLTDGGNPQYGYLVDGALYAVGIGMLAAAGWADGYSFDSADAGIVAAGPYYTNRDPWRELLNVARVEGAYLYLNNAGEVASVALGTTMAAALSPSPAFTFADNNGTDLPYRTCEFRNVDSATLTTARATIPTQYEPGDELDPNFPTGYLPLVGSNQPVKSTSATTGTTPEIVMDGGTLPFRSLNHANAWCSWQAVAGDQFLPSLDKVVILGERDAALWPAILETELGTVVRVKRSPPGGGSAITHDCFVRGLEHQILPYRWQVTMYLERVERWALSGPTWTLGDATLGKLDSGNVLRFGS